MESKFKEEELVKVQGKQYPVVGGRLRIAHEGNKELSITTDIINITDDRVVVQAKVKTEKGYFSGLGNASAKRDRLLSNALIELAETRSIARALRFAGYGVEFTGFEEMQDEIKDNDNSRESSNQPATKAQLEAIASIARSNKLSSKKLHDIMYRVTGKDKSRDLTSEDISKLMESLKKIGDNDITSIS